MFFQVHIDIKISTIFEKFISDEAVDHELYFEEEVADIA